MLKKCFVQCSPCPFIIHIYTQYGFFKSFFKVNFDVGGAKFVDDPEKIVGNVKLLLIFTFAVTLT